MIVVIKSEIFGAIRETSVDAYLWINGFSYEMATKWVSSVSFKSFREVMAIFMWILGEIKMLLERKWINCYFTSV